MSHTAYKPSDIYRKRFRLRPFITIPLGILLFCLAVFLMLFYGLQRFVVYEQDGVYIDFHQSAVDPSKPNEPLFQPTTKSFEPVPVNIVYHDMDFVDITTNAGSELAPIRALHIDAESVTSENLAKLPTQANSIGANALVLDMKPTSGALVWNSAVDYAMAYGTNGNMLIEPELEALHEADMYMVAQISCFVDGFMSMRNSPIVLATADGMAYVDDTGRWLDPTNPDTRDYVTKLCVELIELGFDEIMLDTFILPQVTSGTELLYFQTGSYTMTPEIALTSFAQELRDEVESAGGKLSVYCNSNSMRNSLQAQTGQVPSAFAKIFDRLYWSTDGNTVASDISLMSAYLTADDIKTRFVPFMYGTDSSESWMYPYSVT